MNKRPLGKRAIAFRVFYLNRLSSATNAERVSYYRYQ